MACANCGSNSTCNCVIRGGNGVSVDGIGSPDFPYVVSVPEDPQVMVWCDQSQDPAGYSLIYEDGSQEYFMSNGVSVGSSKPEMFVECKCDCTSGGGGTIYPDWQSLGLNGFNEMTIIDDGIKTSYLQNLSVTTPKIADQAATPMKVDLSVVDATAEAALTPFEGMLIYRKDLDKQVIYDGSAWRTLAGWELLGKTTLGVAGDTITVNNLPVRKYLHLLWTLIPSGVINSRITLNNDTSANYAFMSMLNQTNYTNNVGQSAFSLSAAALAAFKRGEARITNVANRRKLIEGYEMDDNNTDSSTTTCNNYQAYGKWHNLSNAITRIDLTNVGAGDFAAGSELIVLGADF
jgi:hypothetical protein